MALWSTLTFHICCVNVTGLCTHGYLPAHFWGIFTINDYNNTPSHILTQIRCCCNQTPWNGTIMSHISEWNKIFNKKKMQGPFHLELIRLRKWAVSYLNMRLQMSCKRMKKESVHVYSSLYQLGAKVVMGRWRMKVKLTLESNSSYPNDNA